MARNFKTEAVMLRKKNLLNRDVLVSLFSESDGKINVFAKGVKKLTSRRSPHLQTGNLIEVLIHRKADRLYLEESLLKSGFSELKKDQEKINLLYQFFFVLERLLPEHQKEETVYNLTKSFLVKLSKLDITYPVILGRTLSERSESKGTTPESNNDSGRGLRPCQNDKESVLTVYFNKLLRLLGYTKKNHDFVELQSIISDLINEKLPSFDI